MEFDGRWRLPLVGLTVSESQMDHQLSLRLGEDTWISVEADAAMEDNGGGPTMPLVPERQEVAVALGSSA
ncbi:hypothetical protein [Streptomyces sp. BPTC-684]|uniref:hypothetical protein n=1 Tax=Streptomyces sp. BPTC-684 TaxID=3043734 RepID=UPI0024B12350|nr:hypothetical protein [Streptomyces sp. BPTC-684]WHM40929.1 hypothetical protein QIY60_31345 [Streptomyces sp. BPTC-684]